MTFKKITIAGSGVLGSQIAFQTALHGYDVTVFDINSEVLEKFKASFDGIKEAYLQDLSASKEQLEKAIGKLSFRTDLAESVKDADLVIEAIPENPAIKTAFYQQLAKVAPEKTVFVTNSSTLWPSLFAEATGRPDKFLALHFANQIWKHNTAEIMGHAGTNPNVFDAVVDFAKSIGMVALPLHKEQPGYILNSLLAPLLNASLDLLVKGVADAYTIDKTWIRATGAPDGPFAKLDLVGIPTIYNVIKNIAERTNDPARHQIVAFLKENFIDKGKLGRTTGEGFYKYPDPAYLREDFFG